MYVYLYVYAYVCIKTFYRAVRGRWRAQIVLVYHAVVIQ